MSMFLKRVVPSALITVGFMAASALMVQGRGGAAPVVQDNWPDGDGKKLVLDGCGGCHDLELVKAAKHDDAAWRATLINMQNYGATITAAQIPTVAAYLTKVLPLKPVDPKEVKKEDPDAVGERILNTACTTCHDLGPITRKADDKAAWESVVYGMVGNGADVKDAEIPILVDYLVKHYGPPKPAATPAAPAGRGGARGQ
jgi:cytochrome c5